MSVCSGFASVYLEKILKGDKTSIWVRNIQLCLFSIPLQLFAVYQRDYDKVRLGPELASVAVFARSVPLAQTSIAVSLRGLLRQVMTHGWLYGFCPGTWAVVCMFAFGGLLVAIVIRFADNNLKNLAMALAILLSCLASIPLFEFKPNGELLPNQLLPNQCM